MKRNDWKIKNLVVFLVFANRRKNICTKKMNSIQEQKSIKKIGKVTYEVVVHFNEDATEAMQDKFKPQW